MKHFVLAAALALGLAAPAHADVLSSLQSFGLADVKQAEAIYAANPSVPTFAAAGQCLGFLDATLSAPGAPVNIGVVLEAPKGAVSAIADLDVALSGASNGLPPIVLAFNQNCGGYIEDLKAEAAVHAGGIGLNIFGIKL